MHAYFFSLPASKDDMIITSRARNAKRSKSQAVTNRMSMGDFSRLEPSLTNLLEQHQGLRYPCTTIAGNVSYETVSFITGGLTVKPANPPVVKQPTSSPPGIDLDALAQMMQINNKGKHQMCYVNLQLHGLVFQITPTICPIAVEAEGK